MSDRRPIPPPATASVRRSPVLPTSASSPLKKEENNLSDLASLNASTIRFDKFQTLLSSPVVSLEPLCKLAWSGVPGIMSLAVNVYRGD